MTPYILWAFTFLTFYLLWLVYLTVKSWMNKSGTLRDYFLAGNDVGFIPSLLTFWATYFSAAALIGASGSTTFMVLVIFSSLRWVTAYSQL